MTLRLYNTLKHEIADFVPLKPGPDAAAPLRGASVSLYTCGPTVYDLAHIGNFRAFLFADLLRRVLEFDGATVQQVMNMTDVGHMTDDAQADGSGEDKMAVAARRLKENKKSGVAQVENPDDPYQVAEYFITQFLHDARQLGLRVVGDYDAAPDAAAREKIMPRPTHYIAAFIAMIEKLIARGHAYVGIDGVVYYDIRSFPAYGCLSGNVLERLSHGAGGRTASQAAKKHPADFFLWKPDARHLMRWPSPWGEGYPGWHIECSAMATQLLGDSLDLHTGGEDNIFPHHECEIAQSEGATGHPFVRYWLHTRHLMVDGTKMSKSKGNFFTIRDLLAKGFQPVVIRYALITTRYREPMNFTLQGLHDAAAGVTTLRDLAARLEATPGWAEAKPVSAPEDVTLINDFRTALHDDLNIAGAVGAVYTWATNLSKQRKFPLDRAAAALACLRQVDGVLGVVFTPLLMPDAATETQITALMAQRTQARNDKDWARSDTLRGELAALGVIVKDTPTGATWTPRLAPSA
jgi:cysteinyl-tRNA synthetase